MPPERASISFISSYPCIGRSFSSESSARRTSPDSKKRRRQPHGSPSWPRPSKPPNHERERPLPGPRLCILIQPALKAPPPHRAERPRGQQNTNANCYIVRYISARALSTPQTAQRTQRPSCIGAKTQRHTALRVLTMVMPPTSVLTVAQTSPPPPTITDYTRGGSGRLSSFSEWPRWQSRRLPDA